jgi:hypothetical protein
MAAVARRGIVRGVTALPRYLAGEAVEIKHDGDAAIAEHADAAVRFYRVGPEARFHRLSRASSFGNIETPRRLAKTANDPAWSSGDGRWAVGGSPGRHMPNVPGLLVWLG